MDFLKWGIVLSSLLFLLLLLSIAIYIALPFLLGALTGTAGACEPPYGDGAPSSLHTSLSSLCMTATSFLGAVAMVMILLSSPVLFISNALVSFEIFDAKSEGGPKIKWLAIVWALPAIGGLAYLFRGRKNFRAA